MLWLCRSQQGFHTDHGSYTLVYSVLHPHQSYKSSPPQCQWPLPVRAHAHNTLPHEKHQKQNTRRTIHMQLWLNGIDIYLSTRKLFLFIQCWVNMLCSKLTTRAIVSKLKPESLTISPSLNIGHSGALSGLWRHLLIYAASIPSTRLLLKTQLDVREQNPGKQSNHILQKWKDSILCRHLWFLMILYPESNDATLSPNILLTDTIWESLLCI